MTRYFPLLALALFGCNPDTGDTDETDTNDTDTIDTTPTEHCGTITAAETWEKGLHHVTCDVYVDGPALTLEPGVDVRFDANHGLYIGYNGMGGQLVAEGTEEDPIRLRSLTSEGRGLWTGIVVRSPSNETRLAELTLEDAGGMYTDGALSVDGGSVMAKNVTIRRAEGAAFWLTQGARFSAGSAGLVVDDAGSSGRIDASAADSVPEAGADLGGADDAMVKVAGGDLDTDAAWNDLGVPYFVDGDIYVDGSSSSATLSVGPGTEVVFASNHGIWVSYNDGPGGFVAAGTEAAPVILRGPTDGQGLWSGIVYRDATVDGAASLSWTTLADAGGMYVEAALTADDATVKVDHLTITRSDNAGFRLVGDGKFDPASTELVVTASDSSGYSAPAGVASIPEVGEYTGNTVDRIDVDGSNVEATASWGDLGVPYYVMDDLHVGGPSTPVLTLAAGVDLQFANDRGLYVGYSEPGALVATGTAANPVTLRSAAADPGAWSGLVFSPNTAGGSTHLDYVDVGYGGGAYTDATVYINGCSPSLSHAYIHDSDAWGIIVHNGSPTLTDITYANNPSGNLSVD